MPVSGAEMPAGDNFGWIVVDQPVGASVFLDGENVGVVPVKLLVKPGRHTVRLEVDMYSPNEQTVNVVAGSTVRVAANMKRCATEVTVTAHNGCMIYIDGQLKGFYKWSGVLDFGEHQVEVRKQYCEPLLKTINVSESNTSFKLPELVSKRGSLSVTSYPSGASVYVDGTCVGTTPLSVSSVAAGEKNVIVKRSHCQETSQTVFVYPGKNAEVTFHMLSSEAIKISSQPASARLTLNGQSGLNTPYRGNVEAGTYDVTLQRDGYKPLYRTIEVDSTHTDFTFKMKVQKMRNFSLYAGVGLQPVKPMSWSLYGGLYMYNLNLEVDWWSGLKPAGDFGFTLEGYSDHYVATIDSPRYLDVRLGYGIILGTSFRITPQVGLGSFSFKMTPDDPDVSLDPCKTKAAIFDVKLDYAITKWLGISVCPAYSLPFKPSENYEYFAEVDDIFQSYVKGFNMRTGLYFFF